MPTESTALESERELVQACGWLFKMHSGDCSDAEYQKLADWCEPPIRHTNKPGDRRGSLAKSWPNLSLLP